VSTRLLCWVGLIGAVAAINYAAYGRASTGSVRDEIYSYSAFADGTIFYGVILGLVLLIALDRADLLALRVPRSLPAAAGIALSVIVAILVWEYVVTALPIEDPGQEQGLTPTHWEPAHAGAFAANVVLFVAIAPIVEEIAFRGVGQSLWRSRIGALPAVAVVGLFFGVWHGLLVALLVLVPFGWALGYLRERTGSVVPGMVVHGLFNGAALAVAVLS
jgi:membrane protease YdiL (CAAX protease family)